MRIIIVEDEAAHAEAISRAFTASGTGAEIQVAGTLGEFLELVVPNPPDIVLMDLNMPDGRALDLLTRFPAPRSFPILIMTSHGNEQTAVEALKSGALDYVVKSRETFAAMPHIVTRALREWDLLQAHKRMEEAVLASEAKYRHLHESMMDAFARVDLSGRIVEFNSAFQNMLGYSAEELLSLTYSDITPVNWHADETRILEQQVLARGYSDVYEKEYRRNDGTLIPVELRTNLLRDDEGRPCGMWAVIRDISARKQAEIALRVREAEFFRLSQEFNALLDSLPDGIVQIARDLRVIWVNRSMREMIRSDDVQVKGNCCYESFWGNSLPCVSCPVARSFHSGELEMETLSTPDGRFLELRAVPISDVNGMVESVIEVIRDISEHKKLEAQLLQSQKMESIGTLAGGIAHDFNNILTAIVGYGHLALMDMAPDNPQRLNIDHMLEASNRAANLTKDLLIFSRKQVGNKRPVDLNETVRTVEKFLVRVIGEDIDCRITEHSKQLVVLADTHQLEQVLMNLATNARDAMPRGGDLMISVGRIALEREFASIHGYGKPGSYALLTVSDTGDGIDEETRRKIFEPFFTTKEVGKGTGLGLAVVYGIIKQHDGFINVYSEPGIGTTFKIYLPLISSQMPDLEKSPEQEVLTRGTETILIAEDNEPARTFLISLLRQEGYTVIAAIDGRDAVNRFMENQDGIQLLLFDLIMPKLGGLEAYEQIRATRPDVKMIMMSGYAPDMVRQKMLRESSIELLYKPIVPHTLLKMVRTVLDQDTQ